MDFVKISYTARIKDGKAFDTTSEDIAKKEEIFDEKKIYKPLAVVIGASQVVEGLDSALKEMKVNEHKTVELSPEKAYGPRDPKLIRLIPLGVFKKQKITPIPGMPVELDGRVAKVQTVAGGRVRVDFNSELAGRTVVFDVKLEEKAKNDEEKVKYLIERSFNDSKDFEIKLKSKSAEIILPEVASRDRNILLRKASLSAEIFKCLELDDITFTENWKNPKKAEKKEEKKSNRK